jgi:hypothetical protein
VVHLFCVIPIDKRLNFIPNRFDDNQTNAKQMKKYVNAFLYLAALLALPVHSFGQDKLEGVVVVKAFDEYGNDIRVGAGIIVGCDLVQREMYIITAYHVIRDAHTFKIQENIHPKRDEYTAQLGTQVNEELDLAVLIVDVPASEIVQNYYKFKKSNTKKVKPKTPVTIVGHPFGHYWLVNEENRIIAPDDPSQLKFTKHFLDYGNSGGPVMKKKGALLGMATTVNPNNSAEAAKIDDILFYLDQWKIPYNLVRKPIKKGTYYMAGAGTLLGLSSYYFYEKRRKSYHTYTTYQVENSLLVNKGKTRDEVMDNAKMNNTLHVITFVGSAVGFGMAIVNELGWLEKKPSPSSSGLIGNVTFYPEGLGLGMAINF